MQKPQLPTKPTPPEPTDKKIIVPYEICNTTDRVYNWAGWGEPEKHEYDEQDNEIVNNVIRKMGMASRGQEIYLADIIKNLPDDVKIEDLYFTASFDDDHLQLHVRYDREVSLYEQEMKKYRKNIKDWEYMKKQYDKNILIYENELKKELASIKMNKSSQ